MNQRGSVLIAVLFVVLLISLGLTKHWQATLNSIEILKARHNSHQAKQMVSSSLANNKNLTTYELTLSSHRKLEITQNSANKGLSTYNLGLLTASSDDDYPMIDWSKVAGELIQCNSDCKHRKLEIKRPVIFAGDLHVSEELSILPEATSLVVLGDLDIKGGIVLHENHEIIAAENIYVQSISSISGKRSQLLLHSRAGNIEIKQPNAKALNCLKPLALRLEAAQQLKLGETTVNGPTSYGCREQISSDIWRKNKLIGTYSY